MKYGKNNKIAFTLAEVLIVLVIVGVIASVTIPLINLSVQKRDTISKLKKAYSVLNNWTTRAQVDFGHFSTWELPEEIGLENYYKKYITPYFNIMKYCDTGKKCGYKSNIPFKALCGDGGVFVNNANRFAFLTIDGFSFSFVITHDSTQEDYPVIKVDLNGGKLPNTYGRDVFMFVRTLDKGIKPFGFDYSWSKIKSECSKKSQGNSCSSRIIRNSWEFDDDYPW